MDDDENRVPFDYVCVRASASACAAVQPSLLLHCSTHASLLNFVVVLHVGVVPRRVHRRNKPRRFGSVHSLQVGCKPLVLCGSCVVVAVTGYDVKVARQGVDATIVSTYTTSQANTTTKSTNELPRHTACVRGAGCWVPKAHTVFKGVSGGPVCSSTYEFSMMK